MTQDKLREILRRHGIHVQFFKDFQLLLDEGVIVNSQFRLRLNTCLNYKAALDEISERVVETVTRFQSLEQVPA